MEIEYQVCEFVKRPDGRYSTLVFRIEEDGTRTFLRLGAVMDAETVELIMNAIPDSGGGAGGVGDE